MAATTTWISKLLDIGSAALAVTAAPAELSKLREAWGARGRELADFLQVRNGLYACESALLVRPLAGRGPPLGLTEWNDPALWKREYGVDLTGRLFFAEDAFGGQFGIIDDRIASFDPETGARQDLAASLERWCRLMLEDYPYRTGHPIAAAWQVRKGALPMGHRLIPAVPFACGGTFSVENLAAIGEVETMRFRALIENAIRDLPDGTKIRIVVTD